MHWYNTLRRHGSLRDQTPQQKWDKYYQKMLFTFALSGQAEAGNAGAQPARNILINGDDGEGILQVIPSPSQSSLLNIPLKTQPQKEEIDLNSFEKTVQFIGG